MVKIGKWICGPIVKKFLNYVQAVCPGIIDQQFRDAILPAIFDELLSTQTLCTFELELCDMDKWEKMSLSEFMETKL